MSRKQISIESKPALSARRARFFSIFIGIMVVILTLTTFSLRAQAVPLIGVPAGIEEGNKYILAQGSGGGSSNGGAMYDPLRRIVKIVETRSGTVTSTKQFVWDGDQLCEERDAGSTVTKRFYPLGEQISGTDYYFTKDHNDSVREMTDSSGAVQSQFSHSPFGQQTQIAGTGAVPDFGYAGMYVHQPSGLNLAVDRAYDPNQGRWISRDPLNDVAFKLMPHAPEPFAPDALLGMHPAPFSSDPVLGSQLAMPHMPVTADPVQDTNLYAYVGNDPVNRRDPSGLAPWGYCNNICSTLADATYRYCRESHNTEFNCRVKQACVYASCMAACLAAPTPKPPEARCPNNGCGQ